MKHSKSKLFALSVMVTLSSTVKTLEDDTSLSNVSGASIGEKSGPNPGDTFTRMFPRLPPFAEQTDAVREANRSLGEKGGVLDAADDLSDPVRSITEPATFSPNNPDNPDMTAGVTFVGQFIDHDLTLDLKSPLSKTSDPRRTNNFRTAAFDLDSVYGGGPDVSPQLYDQSSEDIKFRISEIPGSESVSRHGAVRMGLPRGTDNAAIIGDGRNDENIIIAGLHVAMLGFHNAIVDRLRTDPDHAGDTAEQIFEEAQRLVRWHYQWIVVNEFLPLTIGQSRVTALLKEGPRFYKPGRRGPSRRPGKGRRNPKIPVEFVAAAYRFGHSQVRPSYRVNFGADENLGGEPFFAFVFDDNEAPSKADPNDLRGGKLAPRRFVDWQTFFDFGDDNSRPNKRIDAKLSSVLMELPGARAPAPGLPSDGEQSLASRNLIRHVNFGLPSGQAIAQTIGAPTLSPDQLAELKPFSMETSTPLWFYVLKEAEVMEQGLRLGPVGSLIVGEVFIGLLRADPESYLSAQPGWKPELPSAKPGDFRITDFLKFAGVVPPL